MKGKRVALWSGIVAVVVIAGIAIAGAQAHRAWGRHGWGRWGWRGPAAMGYVSHELNLSQAQRKQVRSLWEAEKPTVSSLVAEFASEDKEMDEATAGGNLDQAKVQEIAAREGTTVSKLLVQRARLESKIYSTVLTPEQRTKADKMKERWHDRLGRIAHHSAFGS